MWSPTGSVVDQPQYGIGDAIKALDPQFKEGGAPFVEGAVPSVRHEAADRRIIASYPPEEHARILGLAECGVAASASRRDPPRERAGDFQIRNEPPSPDCGQTVNRYTR